MMFVAIVDLAGSVDVWGSVVYFVVEFCPEVVAAMLFDATASALF
jgi:hypothetical protein